MYNNIFKTFLFAGAAAAKILYAGVNESGGEFGGDKIPGTFGSDYAFVNTSTVDIYVDSNRVNVFRVAFLLERMCPLATGLGSTFDETHFSRFQDAVNHITVTKGAYAILDPHNYMRYNNPSTNSAGSIIGNTADKNAATTAQFAQFWGAMATRFKGNEKVIFGLMNEPHDMSTQLILQNNQAAITAIRGAGAKQLILAPGNGYTGGHSWTQSSCSGCEPSSDYLYKLSDPINNTALDIHEYLDSDFSGTHQACVNPGPAALASLTSWLQQHGLKAFVSEVGGSANSMCAQDLKDLLNYLSTNDVYIGWAAWAAGPLWGSGSPCCNDKASLGSLEPNVPAAGGAPPMYNTVWVPTIQPLVPSTLKRSGVSGLQ